LKKGVDEAEAVNRINKANLAFPDALVQNYKGLKRRKGFKEKLYKRKYKD
jgi:hypothetical protein